jgi:hypothetical protein
MRAICRKSKKGNQSSGFEGIVASCQTGNGKNILKSSRKNGEKTARSGFSEFADLDAEQILGEGLFQSAEALDPFAPILRETAAAAACAAERTLDKTASSASSMRLSICQALL